MPLVTRKEPVPKVGMGSFVSIRGQQSPRMSGCFAARGISKCMSMSSSRFGEVATPWRIRIQLSNTHPEANRQKLSGSLVILTTLQRTNCRIYNALQAISVPQNGYFIIIWVAREL
jgi:hypothetical protein